MWGTGPPPRRDRSGLYTSLLWLAILAILASGGTALYFLRQKGAGRAPEEKLIEIEIPTPATPTVAGGRYTHPDGFSIVPPPGWVSLGQFAKELAFRTPDNDPSAPRASLSVKVKGVPLGFTLDDYVNEQKLVLRPPTQLIDDARVKTVTGEPAHILGVIYPPPPGGCLKDSSCLLPRNRVKILLLVKGDRGYTVTGHAQASDWDAGNFNAVFDAALTSLVVP